ncbi:acyl-CoA thioesterase [Kytococcus sedentarius]|uniref:acyl-CoA thioesterase n=1 Tax=Kytococcus sedentarius TaxID=1276 RepID=UPI00387931F6
MSSHNTDDQTPSASDSTPAEPRRIGSGMHGNGPVELPADPFAQLMEVLDIRAQGANTFVGESQPQPHGRAFGGQVLAQCVMAAGRTVEEVDADGPRHIHSLHGYFLRPADSRRPIRFEVERMRDGRSFSARRVHAFQDDQVLLSMITSFQEPAEGMDHQEIMPSVPRPEELPSIAELLEGHDDPRAAFLSKGRPVDMRWVDEPLYGKHFARTDRQSVWVRYTGEIPDDPLLSAAASAYLSDYTLLEPVLRRHGISWTDTRLRPASLDHAMWFHRRPRVGDWMLYTQYSPSAQSGRGLGVGRLFHEDGTLMASVAQEGMVRLKE